MENTLVNRVANSPIVTLNLEHHYPEAEVVVFDIKDYLYMELMLKEKDYRQGLRDHDWAQYEGKVVCIYCSTDAIIPIWAYMLAATYAGSIALDIYQGSPADYIKDYYRAHIAELDVDQYTDRPIVIKGCSDKPVPPAAYMELTRRLLPVAKSIMYGEPCSTVPVYKKPKAPKA